MLKQMTIHFSSEEREVLARLAHEEMRPVKDQVRWLVRQEAQRRGLWAKETQTSEEQDCERVRA